ncbi:MAG: putative metalloprotease CJM1_0395 family protein [Pseudomonadota bacterium]
MRREAAVSAWDLVCSALASFYTLSMLVGSTTSIAPSYSRSPARAPAQVLAEPGIGPGSSSDSNEQRSRESAPSVATQTVNASDKERELVNGLTEQERQQVRDLAARDREVRAHEQAHANVGGRYAGSPTYSYQRGPDGRQYAVGGEVSIDISAVPGDPQATIEKARIVRRAALAPAEPSSQDRAVAAEATALEQRARAELLALDTDSNRIESTRIEATRIEATRIEANATQDDGNSESLSIYTPIDLRA